MSWTFFLNCPLTGLPLRQAKYQAGGGSNQRAPSHVETPHTICPLGGGKRWKVGLTGERDYRYLQQDRFGPLQEGATGRLTWAAWEKGEVQKGLSEEAVSSLSS